MDNLSKVIALGGRRLNRTLAMHYLFGTKIIPGIPDGYISLEYIESTGTQYINIGFTPNQDTRVVCDFQFAETPDTQWIVFGARTGGAGTDLHFTFGYNPGKGIRTDYKNSQDYVNGTFDAVGRHTVDKNKNITTIDGSTVTQTYAKFATTDNDLVLFGISSAGSIWTRTKMRMYSCQIYDNGVLVRDYKPCISPDGIVGLYDVENREFYGNVGTGEFVAGCSVGNYAKDKIISFTDAEWGLDGTTLKNLIGDNYDMTITGSLPYAGKGLTFDGTTNNYISVPAFTELANTTEFTCEMAVNLTNIQSTQRILYLQNFFEFFVRSGKINTDLHLDGLPRENLQGTANTGFITFAAVFKANEYQKLFINGVEVASTTAVSPSSAPASGTIGGNGYPIANGSKFYSMRVYKRALTSDELMRNFEIDKQRFGLAETATAAASVMMLGSSAASLSMDLDNNEEQTTTDELEVTEDDSI